MNQNLYIEYWQIPYYYTKYIVLPSLGAISQILLIHYLELV